MIFRLFWILMILATPIEAAKVSLGASEAEAQTVVGCLFPMSGRGGLYGRDSVVGIQLAFEHLEQQQQAYPPIRVLVSDSSSKASKAVRQVRDFVRNDKVRFICGVVNSAVALQVAQVAEEEKVFFIGTDHASSRLTQDGPLPYYFRVNNNSAQSMQAAARYIKEKFGQGNAQSPLSIAYIGPDYDYGYQVWKDLRQGLNRAQVSYQIETVLWPKLYEPDYSPYLRVLAEKKVDLVVNALWGGDLVAFIQQANQTTLFQHTRFANFDTGGNYEVLAALGEDMPAGLILSSRHHNNWPETEENRWFVERFFAISGRYPSYAAEGAYSGILAIAEVLRIAGSEAGDATMRKVFSTLQLKLPEDPHGFTSFMNPVNHQLQQVIAIGETIPDQRFAPARMMLGHWRIYPPESHAANATE
ncbi:ABC transporter substrate-binding protein [Neptunomonas antarctica]|uniref:Amino acid/amide ABC transporter substrate-binding protein, HAAT family n=1 Tax=Neptunomonas antarctica TaxID=619304 RepID=A0A1N7L0D6_9GAMM|nr:ABC transporter substrate-binding protein [Neptunomonas antarctica]SIS67281.1 amino acid/amide ABC transporter substrate-binding protein, HAAT family [Neptunomonas antarctica]